MASKAAAKELDFIIRVIEPEKRPDGTLAVRYSRKVTKPVDAPEKQLVDEDTVEPRPAGWMRVLLGVVTTALCYLAVAAAEMTRRGYFSIGGEFLFALAAGYAVYFAAGIKKSPLAR